VGGFVKLRILKEILTGRTKTRQSGEAVRMVLGRVNLKTAIIREEHGENLSFAYFADR
jgi:hypothetical protein